MTALDKAHLDKAHLAKDHVALCLARALTRADEAAIRAATRGDVRAAYARQIYQSLLRLGGGLTFQQVAELSKRRADTVRHGVEAIYDDCAEEPLRDEAVEELSEMLVQLAPLYEKLQAMAEGFERGERESG